MKAENEMKQAKYSEEQIVYALYEAEAGTPVLELIRKLGVSPAAFYSWKKKYAGLGVSELRELRHRRQCSAISTIITIDAACTPR